MTTDHPVLTEGPSPQASRMELQRQRQARQLLEAAGITRDDLRDMSSRARHAVDWLSAWEPLLQEGIIELFTARPDPYKAGEAADGLAPLLHAVAATIEREAATIIDDEGALEALRTVADQADLIEDSVHLSPRVVYERACRDDAEPGDRIYLSAQDLHDRDNWESLPVHVVDVLGRDPQIRPRGIAWGNVEQCWTHAVAGSSTILRRLDPATLGLVILDGPVDCGDCQGAYTVPQGVA